VPTTHTDEANNARDHSGTIKYNMHCLIPNPGSGRVSPHSFASEHFLFISTLIIFLVHIINLSYMFSPIRLKTQKSDPLPAQPDTIDKPLDDELN